MFLKVLPPEPLARHHDVSRFANGRHPSLDEWLRTRALTSEGLSARTYVVCDAAEPQRVVGYYTISSTKEQRAVLPTAKLRKGMPDDVPLLLIGRLAVDREFQGLGIGKDLLADAIRRCAAAAGIAGARAILVHALDAAAAEFYRRHGFIDSPLGERALLLPIETVRASLT